MKNIIKPFDFCLIFVVIAVALMIYFAPLSKDAGLLYIYIDGRLDRCVELSENKYEEIEVVSEFGYNKIIIDYGSVRVSESSCENKLEINAGEISKSGQSLICLPNRLVVTIEGKDEYDAVAY